MVRNFDEYVIIDPQGRIVYAGKATGMWVLTKRGATQQLHHYLGTASSLSPHRYQPMFWMLLGAWILSMIYSSI
jgi:hypothetical protein